MFAFYVAEEGKSPEYKQYQMFGDVCVGGKFRRSVA